MSDTPQQEPIQPGAVVIAYDLSPADVARLHREGAAAIVTEVGGATSHMVIMARSLGLPAVVGVPGSHARDRDWRRHHRGWRSRRGRDEP
jgi:phosphoenolpyruvate-protein kinase (PTS system EI component)